MKKILRNNKTYYKYEKKPLTQNIQYAIILYVVAIMLFIISILISYLYRGEAPEIIGGMGVTSIVLDFVSMIFIVLDIYLDKNFQPAIRNMLILQILFIIMWIILI